MADLLPASMEPQLFSCGLMNICIQPINFFISFNGAATFQLRIVEQPVFIHVGDIPASMEPQLFSCGLLKTPVQAFSGVDSRFNGAATFQLRIAGHVFTYCNCHCCFNGAATFQLRIASPAKGTGSIFYKLQWSRNFSVAD